MLAEALPGFSRDKLLKKLKSDRPFIWLARHLTPKQRDKIIHLGIPGVAFRKDSKRLYPQGRLVAHVVGLTNVDDQGIAGLEKSQEQFLRTQGVDLTLSIDVRIQHAIRHELQKGMEEFQATGAAAIVLDMETEEILGMVSLPDFNPNHDVRVTDPGYFNKATVGMYEMGSTFKLINTANGLQSGLMTLSSKYDTSAEVKIGRFTITDYRANHGVISVAEILVHSSNKGSVRILQALGKERQQAFIEKLGCLGRCSIELPERGFPIIPRHWRDANAMTISYGYGIAVSPLHLLNAGATILGDGCRKNATLLKRGNEPRQCERVVDESVASKMRQLARYVVLYGTSKKANVPGYFLAAKTGTRNMLEANGHYNKNRVSTSFIGLIGDALGKPRYMVVAILEDPKASKKTYGFTTSGWNVAPVAGRILARVASITGLKPKPEQLEEGFDPFLKTLNFVKKT
jgi:cell division protein FtsI (penicillin-binding protein 3)